eukprot:m.86673 g.86673  ORF g.86673 m.86673 type:complete len:556 (-) comp8767_c0_seq2:136-1803(-)
MARLFLFLVLCLSPLFKVGVLLMKGVDAVPCPPQSTFLHSAAHNASVCMCDPTTKCFGPCFPGSDENENSFKNNMFGFELNCEKCYCKVSHKKPQLNSFGKKVFHHPEAPQMQKKNSKKKHTKDKKADSVYYYDHPDDVFDKMCNVNPKVTPAPAHALKAINWLHIPKCGTSATIFVYHYMCQDYHNAPKLKTNSKDIKIYKLNHSMSKEMIDFVHAPGSQEICWQPLLVKDIVSQSKPTFPGMDAHDGIIQTNLPYIRGKVCAAPTYSKLQGHHGMQREDKFQHTYVSLFRNPRRRILSAFNYHRHAFGFSGNLERLKDAKTLEAFLEIDGISSCQVKQVLGKMCAQLYTVTLDDTIQSILLMQTHIAFIGDTDYFNSTVCLFHRMFGNRMSEVELKNTRPTSNYLDKVKANGFSVLPKDAWKKLDVKYDKFDWLLFVVANDIFYHNMKRFGISISSGLENEWRSIRESCEEWIGFARRLHHDYVDYAKNKGKVTISTSNEKRHSREGSLFLMEESLEIYFLKSTKTIPASEDVRRIANVCHEWQKITWTQFKL